MWVLLESLCSFSFLLKSSFLACIPKSQRDTIQAASSFAQRNQLPIRLQDQMLAHLCLKFRTDSEGLQQQETLDSLPKAIRSSISHYLFYSLMDKVYLFRGVSNDLLFQLVIQWKTHCSFVFWCIFFFSFSLFSEWILTPASFFLKINFEGLRDESWIFSSKRRCDFAEWSTDRLLHSCNWCSGNFLFLSFVFHCSEMSVLCHIFLTMHLKLKNKLHFVIKFQ